MDWVGVGEKSEIFLEVFNIVVKVSNTNTTFYIFRPPKKRKNPQKNVKTSKKILKNKQTKPTLFYFLTLLI